MSDLELGAAVRGLFQAMRETDRWRGQVVGQVQTLAQKHEPRAQFERWRDSQVGRRWKAAQHRRQQGQCALCGVAIRLKGSHIDHIQPLSVFPELATVPENLQLTCEGCNQRKGQSC
jgi:5-methylcytosine-specific restriction endonuclease McrA